MLSEQIIAVLDNLCEKMGIAIDWTSQNVLPMIQELVGKYITYEICTSVVWIVLMGFLVAGDAAGLVIIQRYITKANYQDLFEDNEALWWLRLAFIIGAVLLAVVFVIVTFCQVFDIVTCITFPEKIILDYLRTFLTSAS